MVHLLRKYQQSLLIAITILVIITFVYYWNGPNQAGRGSGSFSAGNTIAVINGQKVSMVDFQRDVRKAQVALSLGLTDLVRSLAGNSENESQGIENYIWNSMVLRYEADRLQIVPQDSEVQQELLNVPAFQTNGQFDGTKLSLFVQDQLPSKGFTDTVIDDLLRDVVRMKRIKALIGATVTLTPAELHSRYQEENAKMEISVVRLNTSDFEKQINVTDDEARKAFEQRKDQFKSDEQRKVAVAAFELSDAQKQLKGKERMDTLQTLANQAWDLTQAMLSPGANFEELAKKKGSRLSITGTFTANQPDPAIAKVPALTASAFQLTKELPTSDALEGENGYYVVHLEGVVPKQPLTFEQAKTQLVEQMKKQRAAEMLQTKANQARTALLGSLKAGIPFATAAKAAGLAIETVPPFSLTEAGDADIPDKEQVVEAAVALDKGQLSDFIPTAAGGLFVYVNGRQSIAPATAAVGELVVESTYARKQQEAAFLEWLRLRREAARLQITQRG